MATNFPTSLDSLTNPTASDKLNSPSHSTQHATINDAVEAIEAKLGVNGSAVTGTIDYLVKSASSSNPGHKHTLANGATDVTATPTELNYCGGVTSAIQTQITARALKGANTDITSLGGLTTPLSVAQGGSGRATTTAYAVICGGTSATGANQSIASVGTAGQVLTSNGAGALPTFQSTTLYGVYTASDVLLLSADTERTTTSEAYFKIKEVRVIYTGTYRIKFDIKSGSAGTNAYGRVYKNGVAFGTEQANSTTSYVTKSEDLAFSAGDLISLYIKAGAVGGGMTIASQNFRLYGDKVIDNVVITD